MLFVQIFDGNGFEVEFISSNKDEIPTAAIKIVEKMTNRSNLVFGPIRTEHEMSQWFVERGAIGEIVDPNHDEYNCGLAITIKTVKVNEPLHGWEI